MALRSIERQIDTLRSHGVLVKAVDRYHAASPILVGRALESALRIPSHCLRVTSHMPEDFFVHFDDTVHRDRAIGLGRIAIDNMPLHRPTSLTPTRPPGDSALGGITDQVEQVTINEHASVVRSVFTAPPPSVLGPTPAPPPCSTAMATVAPRRSSRQAGKISTTPVAQRATLRLAKELGVIDQEEQRADIAATALTQRLKEPLSEVDMDGLAIMTRLDREALLRAATQASSTRAATPAH
ncbi:uncharacterized protein LOC104583070 [Brachypodium distachyon]|uniref:uncharacterized protein LOC104583070 n=1 Tax=Brachypodium distachyon TaxID=15368 RepID=UPI00052FF1BE|nr:uncharacterized protein LOC104583070 [Brachypodium distachyon]|eukprot:XP_010233075.1 uncharacterized protein LOC104583070 [Brachypodium distachyon]